MACIEAAKLAPSAVNDQPYDIWVAKGEKAAALFETFSGFNKFAKNCPVFVVFTDAPFKCERLGEPGGSGIDYHAQDVGESIAYFPLQAEELGLATCILGGFEPAKTKAVLGIDAHIEIILAVGYATEGYEVRKKIRKPVSENVHGLIRRRDCSLPLLLEPDLKVSPHPARAIDNRVFHGGSINS